MSLTISFLTLIPSSVAGLLIFNTNHDPLITAVGFSLLGFATTWHLIPALKESFLAAKLIGHDINKPKKPIIPESMGVVCATVYLVCLFLFIPFPFMEWLTGTGGILSRKEVFHIPTFPHNKLGEFLSALLSLQSMIFLGFADDVFDIRWRYKLFLPTIASIPLLMVYYVNFGETHIVVPIPLRFFLGKIIDLGFVYYIYMGMVAVFCTNSINILAGVNGIEAGQSLVIASSIAINDWLFLNDADPAVEAHLFSLFLILPFIGVTMGLLFHNWYPSKVFVGDTYCYFAGMIFAVVGILGHFNCPRHRMPKFNQSTNKLEYSSVRLEAPHRYINLFILKLFAYFGLAEIKIVENGIIEVNNFTLINLLLLKIGPMHERN
ncbi:hypothetical protein G9A89_004699 [Geosiphon pyriformis]|nr:hypothetical protein G9A89_004699 [Geosiphon pyriformis]